MLLLLQTRGRMSAQQLADELEVSVRTIYRDVEALSAAGVPVYADRGPAGGYQLLEGYRTRLTGLSAAEAEALIFSGVPGAAAELGLGEVLAAAQLKLSAALPLELRSRAEQVRERFLLDAPGWFIEAEQVPLLAEIANAVWARLRVDVRYQRWDRSVVDRRLEPLGLVLKAGVWYLVAAVDGGEPRTFRVSRVLEVRTLREGFVAPEAFELEKFWVSRQEYLQSLLYKGSAVVRVSPQGWPRLFLLGQVVATVAERAAQPPDVDGWRRTVLPTESLDHAVAALLQLGAEVEVVEPAELRERMSATVAELGRMYGEAGR